jgi:RNA polymerase sigma-70 factor (ECF subfamily)
MIYDTYSPRIYRYAWRLLGDENLAEDCTADTFARFLKAVAAGGGPREHLQAYLYRTAHNWVTDCYRRRGPVNEPLLETYPEPGSDPQSQAEAALQQERVREALMRLSPDQRQVVMLKFIEGWPNEEIARAVNKSLTAVKALQHRALGALRRLLPDEGIEA